MGLIAGMMPSLFREAGEKGEAKDPFLSLLIAMAAVFALLLTLQASSVQIVPNFVWYLFLWFLSGAECDCSGHELFHPF